MLAEFMDPAILGFILIGVMLFSIFIGFPISFTLIFLGFFFGYLGFGKLVFYLMTLQFSMVMTEQTLAAVPLFVFMGIMMEQAGLMERLFSAFQLMLAKVRGSLYYAVLFVSVVFAAATRNINSTKYYACCNGTHYGNTSYRFICCCNYSWNIISNALCSIHNY